MLPSCRVSLRYGSLKSDSNSGLFAPVFESHFFFLGYGPSFSFSFELRKERLRYEFVEAWWCRDWDINYTSGKGWIPVDKSLCIRLILSTSHGSS